MSAAQIALAVLTAALVAAGTVLLALEETFAGWVFSGFGLFGFLMILGLVAAEAQARRGS